MLERLYLRLTHLKPRPSRLTVLVWWSLRNWTGYSTVSKSSLPCG